MLSGPDSTLKCIVLESAKERQRSHKTQGELFSSSQGRVALLYHLDLNLDLIPQCQRAFLPGHLK